MSPAASRPSAEMAPEAPPTSTVPSLPKLESGLPFALKRASAACVGARLFWATTAEPPTRILPSGCTRIVSAPATRPVGALAKFTVATPPVPNPVSSWPLAVNRTMEKSGWMAAADCPACRILPSG